MWLRILRHEIALGWLVIMALMMVIAANVTASRRSRSQPDEYVPDW